ncbi:type II toxin-antitoxin system VapC family toxin [Candidatus Woesearchaeota archaeon]|nr:type II toxin-antitoxin system VapC family toxin [Candidatus Woesearchaeota archaeon]
MEDNICLDTDFLVNFLRNKKEEREFIWNNEEKSNLATTYINVFELFYGVYKSNEHENNVKAVRELINRLYILNLSEESSRKAGEILARLEKEGNTVDFRDLLIGVIALTNNFSIKTNNIKHFSKIKELIIL